MIKTDLRWRRLIAAAAKDAARRAADGFPPYSLSSAHAMMLLREASGVGEKDDPHNVRNKIGERLHRNPTVGYGQSRSNTLDNFRHAFEPAAIDAILSLNLRNGEIAEQFMGNPELR